MRIELEPQKMVRQQLLTEAKAGHKSPINLKYILRRLSGCSAPASGPRNTIHIMRKYRSIVLSAIHHGSPAPAQHLPAISLPYLRAGRWGFYYDIIFYCVPSDARIFGSSLHLSFNPFRPWPPHFWLVGSPQNV